MAVLSQKGPKTGKMRNREITRITTKIVILTVLLLISSAAAGQVKSPTPKPKEVLLDSGGNPISNNEFRDLSMSDPLRKDPFTRTVLADGTVELRLKKNLIEGTTAPVFGVRTIDGKAITAAALKGKVLVLNFWFIGCAGCMEEIPKLNELAAKFSGRDEAVFLSLSTDSPLSLADFIKRVPFNYLHSGDALATINLFGIKTFPRNVVIGKDGKIVYWRSTVKAWEQFERVIRAELAK
jgi:peroxiredoxin